MCKKTIAVLKNNVYFKTLFFIAFHFMLTAIVEISHQQNLQGGLLWIGQHPMPYLLNTFIILALATTVTSLIGKASWSMIVTTWIVMLLTLFSSYKKSLIGDPLFPWDLYQWKNILRLLPNISFSFRFIHVLVLLFLIGVSYLIVLWYKDTRFNLYLRIVTGILSCAVLYLSSSNSYVIYQVLPKANIEDIFWSQSDSYYNNGFIMSFVNNIHNLVIETPNDYSKTAISKNIQKYKNTIVATSPPPAAKPNIVIVMSEAFWDPQTLPHIKFSKDPMPTFTNLKQKHSSGHFISPVFGGRTANAEFEALTGYSTKFLPQGSIPYQEYFHQQTPSIVDVFRKNGYQTSAIHTYYKWFFNRDKAYQYIGFQKFIGLEDLSDPIKKGNYVADEEISKLIIREFSHKPKGKPAFIFAVTMQNHGPYEENRYASTAVKVNSDLLTESDKKLLETYSQGIYDADRSLKTITDYFKKVSEPTYVIFFGDHLPMLGYYYDIYLKSGYLASSMESMWTPAQTAKMYSTPLLVWSNFNAPKQKLGEIGATYLSQYILETAGLELPTFYKFLQYGRQQIRGSNASVTIDQNGIPYTKLPQKLIPLDHAHWLFEYDLLFGKKYTSP